jgi:hypothetical protein
VSRACRRGSLEGGDDALGSLSNLARVDAHVERRHMQAEHVNAGAEVGEGAVCDPGRSVRTKGHVDLGEVAG